MKNVLKYVISIPVENIMPNSMNISLGAGKDGKTGVFMQDSAELGQDTPFSNDRIFPNGGLLAFGKYSLWLSTFGRYITDDGMLEEFD